MCDSVWLDYQEGVTRSGNLIAIDAKVEETQPYTYYASLVWNTGYMGLQCGGGGYYKHIHFSIWDSPDGSPVEVIWKADEVAVERFGGEGTGYKSMYPFNWIENTTYRFCVTLEHLSGATVYKAYFYARELGAWKHLVSIKRNDAQYTFAYVSSFVEDFVGTVQNRRSCLYGNGWLKTFNGEWIELRTAKFGTSTQSYSTGNHDVDTSGKMFRVETGGNTVNNTPVGEILEAESQGALKGMLPIAPIITSDMSTVYIPKGKLMPRYSISTNFRAKSFAAKGLPKGLKVNATTGVVSGKPMKAGTYTVTLTAKKMKGKKVEQQATVTKVVIVY